PFPCVCALLFVSLCILFVMIPPPPASTLFPYTTLFRSPVACHEAVALTKRRGPREAAGFVNAVCRTVLRRHQADEWPWPSVAEEDRKSTRLNSSHVKISYAVFCLKKKK